MELVGYRASWSMEVTEPEVAVERTSVFGGGKPGLPQP